MKFLKNTIANYLIIYAKEPGWIDPAGGQPARIKDLEVIFTRIVKIAAQLAGLGLFIMLLVGGFKYLTSKGDPQQAEGARNTMTYAIIGLVVIISSWLILKILGDVLGVDLLKFEIPVE